MDCKRTPGCVDCPRLHAASLRYVRYGTPSWPRMPEAVGSTRIAPAREREPALGNGATSTLVGKKLPRFGLEDGDKVHGAQVSLVLRPFLRRQCPVVRLGGEDVNPRLSDCIQP